MAQWFWFIASHGLMVHPRALAGLQVNGMATIIQKLKNVTRTKVQTRRRTAVFLLCFQNFAKFNVEKSSVKLTESQQKGRSVS